MTMFWEEMRILSKYTLPVFGFVSSFVIITIYCILTFVVQNAYTGIQSGNRVCSLYWSFVHHCVSGRNFGLHDRQRLRFQYCHGIHEHTGHHAPKCVDISPASACGLMVTANGSVEVFLCKDNILTLFSAIVVAVTLIVRVYLLKTLVRPLNLRWSRSLFLQSGSTRKTYFSSSTKTRKLPGSAVSI